MELQSQEFSFSQIIFSHLSKTMCLSLEKNDVLTLVAINGAAARFDAGKGRDNVTLLRLGVL